MRKTMMAVLMAAAGVSASAKHASFLDAPVVTVCVDQTNIDSGLLWIAQGEASRIFGSIPVTIVWQGGSACRLRDVIHIHFRVSTPEDLHPGALGYARPFEGIHIELFYDRVRALTTRENAPHVLAYVFVHEITHILQGQTRHSDSGIMKAHWAQRDINEMSIFHLTFTPEDIELVKSGWSKRLERLEAALHIESIGVSF